METNADGICTRAEQNDTLKTLLRLCAENPDLPVIPMVWGDVIGDIDPEPAELCYWVGGLESCSIDEYLVKDGIIHFNISDSIPDIEEARALIAAFVGGEECGRMDDNTVLATYKTLLPWKKAILLYINNMP